MSVNNQASTADRVRAPRGVWTDLPVTLATPAAVRAISLTPLWVLGAIIKNNNVSGNISFGSDTGVLDFIVPGDSYTIPPWIEFDLGSIYFSGADGATILVKYCK